MLFISIIFGVLMFSSFLFSFPYKEGICMALLENAYA